MQRTKMPIKERAKIFAPFDALKGFREMLATEELIHEDRKELSEDQINLINETINKLEFGMMIEVVYYVDKENCYKKLTGVFTKLDKVYIKITIIKTKINITDIYKINIIENSLSLYKAFLLHIFTTSLFSKQHSPIVDKKS